MHGFGRPEMNSELTQIWNALLRCEKEKNISIELDGKGYGWKALWSWMDWETERRKLEEGTDVIIGIDQP